MKYIFVFLLLLTGVAYGQTTYFIRADTTKLQKVGASNELVLLNDTRDSLGALVNIGGGKTAFRRFLQNGDTLFLGLDTVIIQSGGSGNTNSNLGAGYRLAIPNTNNIKTLFAGTNITIDSTTNANGLTITASGGGATDTVSLSNRINWKETVFNVKQYGAVGDGVTDDRAAINATVAAASAAGGGIVYFPNGVYWLGTGITDGRGQIIIPMHAYINSTTTPTIKFLGETATPNAFAPEHVTGVRYPSNEGVVLKSGIPVGTNSSVIGSYGTTGGAWSVQNFTRLVLENICVRVYATDAGGAVAAAKDTAINAYALSMLELKSVMVDVACSNDSLLQPATTSVGIIGPPNTNWVKNDYNDVWVIGQYKGAVAFEHSNFDNTFFDACYYGLVSPGTNHTIHGNRMGFWRCKISIRVDSSIYTPGISIDQYNCERRIGSEWYSFVADLDEQTTGQAAGHIRYNTVFSTYNFIRSNPAGSRIFSVSLAGNGYRWSTANRPTSADTATIGLNTTTLNMEYKKIGPGGNTFTEIPSIGQTRNLWTDGGGKWGLGGDPNSSGYLFNVYGDSAATGNVANYVTASTLGKILINNTKASGQGQMGVTLQRGATQLWIYGADFNNDSSWFLYDAQAARTKVWANNGILYLGAHASSFSGTGAGITILDNKRVTLNGYGAGSITGTPTYTLQVTSTGEVIEGTGITGTGAANRVAYWTGTNTISSDADLLFDGSTLSIKPATYWTSNYHFRVGDLITQNYALNNTYMIDNGFYNGAWTRLNTGYTSGFHIHNGQVMMMASGTGTGTFTPVVPFKADNNQTVVIGGNISNVNGTYTGGSLLVNQTKINNGKIAYFGDITSTPTARIHIAAGTATASTAPLKFTSGTNLTTGEAGAMEYDGTSLFFTPTGTTRLRNVLTNNTIPSNGQIPIGNGTNYTNANITSTGSTITVTNGAGTLNLEVATTLASGTYTPTPTNTTNIASSTAYDLQYLRVGNTVTVSGKVDITTTATGASELRMTVPVSNGNFSSDGQAGGTAHPIDKNTGSIGITSNSGSVLVAFRFISDDTSAHTYWFSYTYQILIP